ncbi:MAG: DUF459 domain-containing protein [Acidimicrobiia bacterium]|nr:DUF459 domain-containing protein [Acidimicrobiia bacterium]
MIRPVSLILLLAAVVGSSCGSERIPAATGGDPAPSAAASATTTTSPTSTIPTAALEPGAPSTTLPPALRPITDAEPLRLWAIGDSFLELFGPALVNRSLDTGVIDPMVDFRYVSGLSRPDFFDWPAHIASELPEVSPDAVVVMFGGNDAQDVELGGERFDVGTEAWNDLYAARVAEAMDVLLAGVDRIYWIGLPIMRSDRFTANAIAMNNAYETAAAVRPGVTYFSCFELFQDEDGEYSAYLDGKLMRFTDGAHFVWNGAYRLADAVLPLIADDWNFELES